MAANEQQQEEQRELREPAHHARRPMNAFLIFCKRHRGSVRSGFPHLENRAVTRVLGEWWATLHPDQKRSYTNLAQEYKDAFLNANPDFKWYKLPAPPLRTLTTRPSNKKSELGSDSARTDFESNENGDEDETDSTKAERREAKSQGQSIQPGKLADESQIGGLSSLFTPQKAQSSPAVNVNGNTNDVSGEIPKPPKKRYIDHSPQSPLPPGQKRECKVDLFGEKKKTKMKKKAEDEGEEDEEEESNNNDQQHLGGESKSIGNKSYYDGGGSVEEGGFRGERTCKGLRYQKFLAEQLRIVGPAGQQAKRRRATKLQSPEELPVERRNSISSNFSEKTDSVSSEGGGSIRGDLEHLVESAEGKLEASKPEETETEGAGTGTGTAAGGPSVYGAWTPRKRFKAEDFNLEKKIEALPSLSLEEFQEKKKLQRTKKKKILQKLKLSAAGSKQLNDQSDRKSLQGASANEIDTLEETEKALLIGSQKRKARKQSITRNAAASSISNCQDDQETKQWCSSPDLEALACLATVAANRTKLTK